ncbi:MAG: hypothetical protein ACRCTA_03135 [Bacilli bacterium]
MKYLVLITLMIGSFQDIRKGEVSNLVYLILSPLILVTSLFKVLIVIGLLYFISKIFHLIEDQIGGADLKLILILILYIPLVLFNKWLLMSFVLALCYGFLFKQKTIRMYPFFLMGYLMVFYEL